MKQLRLHMIVIAVHTICPLTPLRTGNPETGSMANSEDVDEIPLKAVFHQGLHCLLGQNQRKKYIMSRDT